MLFRFLFGRIALAACLLTTLYGSQPNISLVAAPTFRRRTMLERLLLGLVTRRIVRQASRLCRIDDLPINAAPTPLRLRRRRRRRSLRVTTRILHRFFPIGVALTLVIGANPPRSQHDFSVNAAPALWFSRRRRRRRWITRR